MNMSWKLAIIRTLLLFQHAHSLHQDKLCGLSQREVGQARIQYRCWLLLQGLLLTWHRNFLIMRYLGRPCRKTRMLDWQAFISSRSAEKSSYQGSLASHFRNRARDLLPFVRAICGWVINNQLSRWIHECIVQIIDNRMRTDLHITVTPIRIQRCLSTPYLVVLTRPSPVFTCSLLTCFCQFSALGQTALCQQSFLTFSEIASRMSLLVAADHYSTFPLNWTITKQQILEIPNKKKDRMRYLLGAALHSLSLILVLATKILIANAWNPPSLDPRSNPIPFSFILIPTQGTPSWVSVLQRIMLPSERV